MMIRRRQGDGGQERHEWRAPGAASGCARMDGFEIGALKLELAKGARGPGFPAPQKFRFEIIETIEIRGSHGGKIRCNAPLNKCS